MNTCPERLAQLMLTVSSSPIVFFILSITIFTLLAAVLEGLPAIIICLPIFLPIAIKFRIDPLHYSIVVVAATGLGLFLPPVGIGLYIASSFANLSADKTFRAMLPYTAVLAVGHRRPDDISLAHPRRSTPGFWLILQRRIYR